ncbi:hypothetical protein PRIPAC_82896 [Pristionchus pacificus]|uniref:Uncharacterized protein n=1 Tax=Pristionchus pacificus TaxID=54126 RepID=A0A2A6BX96_PRIPA|nr:hypothetical protein PRIPAC_82896 [Pristionchus pacificus]|eukprot:PDM70383.1 hypothetical protein PRIPAC_46629 [Pristionchus pacificus]
MPANSGYAIKETRSRPFIRSETKDQAHKCLSQLRVVARHQCHAVLGRRRFENVREQSAHGAADALEDVGEGVLMVDDGGNERGGELKGGYGIKDQGSKIKDQSHIVSPFGRFRCMGVTSRAQSAAEQPLRLGVTDRGMEGDGFDLANGSILAHDTTKDQRSNLRQFPIVLLDHLSTAEAEEPIQSRLVQLRIECASDDDRVVPQALRIQPAVEICTAPQARHTTTAPMPKIQAVLPKTALRLERANSLVQERIDLALSLRGRLRDVGLRESMVKDAERACGTRRVLRKLANLRHDLVDVLEGNGVEVEIDERHLLA